MASRTDPRVAVLPGPGRYTTSRPGTTTRHSFSFGGHYDPDNVGHGLLVAHNEELLGPGAGYEPHPHRHLEIVSWVLEGTLAHADDHGHDGLVGPGGVQVLSAGAGVRHSERNAAADGPPVRFVQAWLRAEPGGTPGYAVADLAGALAGGDLVPVVSGVPHVTAPVRLGRAAAALHAARVRAGGAVRLPDAPRGHLFVAAGAVEVAGTGPLVAGDAARTTAAGPLRVSAGPAGAEVLFWEMHP